MNGAVSAEATMLTIAGTIVAAGILLLIYAWPKNRDKSQVGRSFVRSWIAVSLVIGLLLFTGAVLLDSAADSTLRTTLVTALTTSVAAAIAFYFAAKSGDRALEALTPTATETVPDLTDKTYEQALRLLGATRLKLVVNPLDAAAAPKKPIGSQTPPAESQVQAGSSVTIFFK